MLTFKFATVPLDALWHLKSLVDTLVYSTEGLFWWTIG